MVSGNIWFQIKCCPGTINSKFHSDHCRSGKTHKLHYTRTKFKKQIISIPEKHIKDNILISGSDFKNKAPWRGWKQTMIVQFFGIKIDVGGRNDQILGHSRNDQILT